MNNEQQINMSESDKDRRKANRACKIIYHPPGGLMACKRQRQARDLKALAENGWQPGGSAFAGRGVPTQILHDPCVFYDERF